jgi:hypothetical protein
MTLNKNLPILHKKPNTAIIERAKEVTAIMEHPMTEDDLTHPGLYRLKRNSIPCYTYRMSQNTTEEIPKPSTVANSDTNWDLYPGLIRDIENEGSPEQVEKLHRMQHNLQ